MINYQKPSKINWIKRLLRRAYYYITYFSAENRRDRAQIAFVMTTLGGARKALEQRIKAKNRNGDYKIHHGGTITAPPFPARGSLLTDDERNDPMGKL